MSAAILPKGWTRSLRMMDEKRGMSVQRHFTADNTGLHDVKKMFGWKSVDCVVRRPDGSEVFRRDGVEVPSGWSQTAADILAKLYCRKRGGSLGETGERSAWDVCLRIVTAICLSGAKSGVFASAEDESSFGCELIFLMLAQRLAFNSPVFFNVGLRESYGISGAGQVYWYDPAREVAERMENVYEHPQASACFLASVSDDLGDILDLVKQEVMLFKGGSGVGSNFSCIRGKQEAISGGGTASGVISFLRVFDRAAGATKSGGTTRRAAKMCVLDMDHPEIADFIDWKAGEERKVRVLIGAGYSNDFNAEAYDTVAGQNSNNSVRVSDDFLLRSKLTGLEGEWRTTARTTGLTVGVYQASELWDRVASAAWYCADPGVMFGDTMERWNTVKAWGPVITSNPCAEYMHVEDSACNLLCHNLLSYLSESGDFDTILFEHASRVGIIAQDILVGHAGYPSAQIAENSYKLRPLGQGYANLGALLMALGVPYDSDEGRAWCSAITCLMHARSYATSAELAKELGPFVAYPANKECMLEVIEAHVAAWDAKTGFERWLPRELMEAATAACGQMVAWGRLHGYRNAQATLLMPAGTIGFVLDCSTTGVEPAFSLAMDKALAGGGTMRLVNSTVRRALTKLMYGDGEIEQICAHVALTGTVEGSSLRDGDLKVFECAVPGSGTRFLSPESHLKMVAAAQPFLSGAVSKTCNVPHETTPAQIRELYELGHRLGLKAVAIYRDGSKACQPLTTTRVSKVATVEASTGGSPQGVSLAGKDGGGEAACGPARRRLLRARRGTTYELGIGQDKLYLRTGEYADGSLGELFMSIQHQGGTIAGFANSLAKSISLGLQHGIPLEAYVKLFAYDSFEPAGGVQGHANVKMCSSLPDLVVRVLAADYLQDHTLSHVVENAAPSAVTAASGATDGSPDGLGLRRDSRSCSVCHQLAYRVGACYACSHCGNTTGCG
jgi:ribonucleoside-diphosphate reductase alpha chain